MISHPVISLRFARLPVRAPRSSKAIGWKRLGAATLASVLIVASAVVWIYHRKAASFDLQGLAGSEPGWLAQDRKGRLLGAVSLEERIPVRLEDLPAHVVQAVLSTEDARFFEHPGYDLRSIGRALIANLRAGSIRQGGSTLTQQLARQSFQMRERSFDRKLTELFLARRIEGQFCKEEILERYLNSVFLGERCYGIGAGSRRYFGKSAADLELNEAAVLASMIKNPTAFSVRRQPVASRKARDRTLERMRVLGALNAEEARALMEKPLPSLVSGPEVARPLYTLAQVRREHTASAGKDRSAWIRLTLDGPLQAAVEECLEAHCRRIEADPEFRRAHPEGERLQAAVMLLDHRTGEILVHAGGRNYFREPFDHALLGRHRPGPALSPFVYLAALENQAVSDLGAPVLDLPLDNRRVSIGTREGTLGEWGVEGIENRYEGFISAAAALHRGKNAATVRIGGQVGVPAVANLLQSCGVNSPLRNVPALYLGESALTLAELTRAYAVFPTLGRRPAHFCFDADGPVAAPVPVARPEACLEVLAVLSATLKRANYAAVLAAYDLPVERLFGRGATSYGFRDAWFVGGDSRYTCGVWVGMEDGGSLGHAAFSTEFALPLWASTLELAGAGKEPLPIGPETADRIAALLEAEGAPAAFPRPPKLANAKAVRPLSPPVLGADPFRSRSGLASEVGD